MPIYPPRSEPTKKQQELTRREMELVFVIKKNGTPNELKKAVDTYRQAQLSMLKAKIHTFKENMFQEKPNNVKLEKLGKLIIEWTGKTNDDIISDVKKTIFPVGTQLVGQIP